MCVRACVRVCVRACVRACVHACICVCVQACALMRTLTLYRTFKLTGFAGTSIVQVRQTDAFESSILVQTCSAILARAAGTIV